MLLSVNKIELTVRCIRVPFRGSMSTVKKKIRWCTKGVFEIV